MHKCNNFSIPSETAKTIVQAIEYATGDGILEDMRSHGLKTGNSIPSRIWDFINTELFHGLSKEGYFVFSKRRGIWEMVIIYEKSTQCIFTIMREKRFKELQKGLHKRNHMHYLDILTKTFNASLPSLSKQTSFFDPIIHTFADEEELSQKAEELLSDLGSQAKLVRNHILILFEAEHCTLSSVRAVMITPRMDIADGYELDLSQYITLNVSSIVDTVHNPDSAANTPTRGLHLTSKAMNRQKKNITKKAEKIISEKA